MAHQWYVKINGVDYSVRAPNGRLAVERCLREHEDNYGMKKKLSISAHTPKDRKIESVGGA